MSALDLDAYFARIGYTGPRDATLSTLHAIVAAHIQTIPFENLDVLLGRPIALGLDAIQDKLVHARRGGYCFEQNGLLLAVLEALGFHARPISARVRLQRTREEPAPRTHVFVRVELDGASWLADVGVGGLSPTAALHLVPDLVQPTPHETRRIVVDGPLYFHQALLGGVWSDVCEFTLEEMPLIDRELGNWFTSTHPQSHFRHRLLVARAAPDGVRKTILNDEFSVRGREGRAETQKLASLDALLAVLAEHFGLHFPAGTHFGKGAWPG